jgi:hypothetical protein
MNGLIRFQMRALTLLPEPELFVQRIESQVPLIIVEIVDQFLFPWIERGSLSGGRPWPP